MMGLAVAFIVHFALLKIHGELRITEPSLLIWSLELTGFIAIIIFGILNVKGELK